MLAQAEIIQVPDPVQDQQTIRRSSPGSSNIQRKVSFREDSQPCPACTCGYGQVRRGKRSSPTMRMITNGSATLPLLPQVGNSEYLPVERAVVKSFSIDKMRPICPVCNPQGDTPYPPDFPIHPDQSSESGKGDKSSLNVTSSTDINTSLNTSGSSSSGSKKNGNVTVHNNNGGTMTKNGHANAKTNGIKHPIICETTQPRFV